MKKQEINKKEIKKMFKKGEMTVQVRGVERFVKERAELVAKRSGFNSLQDAIRLFITDVAFSNRIDIKMKVEQASPELEQEILESLEDYRQGNYVTLESEEDILQHSQQLLDEIAEEERVSSQKDKKIRKEREKTTQVQHAVKRKD